MKKLVFAIVAVLIVFQSFAQEAESRERRVNFAVTTGYRITPIYLSGVDDYMTEYEMLTPVFYSEDRQISGSALGYEVSYLFRKIDFSVIFAQSFRYDHIFFDTKSFNPTEEAVYPSVNDFIADYHFILEKSFRYRNDNLLNLRVGYSLMNRGTSHSKTKSHGEFQGETLYSTSGGDFNFQGFNFSTGYEKNRIGIDLGAYITDKHKYNQESQLLIPYFKLKYKVFKN